ncbi:hypothetical protein [Sandaracinus amylolyticus]|uniref:hypothetical protein n=1 Tax=Sandaracinus amylolyticus TaxID=927083 RepID=UPI001F1F8DAA|nr:hypothetical protein [Sandaracinus amylolyticus]UJR85438.1 Hypothetical protein I5071_75180 [Sandaracinus amylolyticus]
MRHALLALAITLLAACGDDDAPAPMPDAGGTLRVDSGPPPSGCGGRATACSALGEATCTMQGGCALEGTTCGGEATSCGSLTTRTTCESQQGCRWL